MIRFTALISLFSDLPEPELRTWIARGWVRPERDPAGDWVFADIDIARVRLIHDFRRDLAIEEDTMPVVLSLIDQIHELRRAFAARANPLWPGD